MTLHHLKFDFWLVAANINHQWNIPWQKLLSVNDFCLKIIKYAKLHDANTK